MRAAALRRCRSASSRSSASLQAGLTGGASAVSSLPVGVFFIETGTGQVATQHQLVEAGIAPPSGLPPRPWLRIQGSSDASTMWYAVLRKREKGIFIGTLAIRHGGHHASLLELGWEEVAPQDIHAPGAPAPTVSRSEITLE